MAVKKYSLGIVQTHATQTEGPLFNQMSRQSEIDLTVYYTKPYGEVTFDKEIGLNPDWDNAVIAGYHYKTRIMGFLDAGQFMTKMKKDILSNNWRHK